MAGIKDLALFKVIGGAIKKGKDKVTAVTASALEHKEPDPEHESVMDTFKASFSKDALKNTLPQKESSVDVETKEEETASASLKKEAQKQTAVQEEAVITKSAEVVKESVKAETKTTKAPVKKATAPAKKEEETKPSNAEAKPAAEKSTKRETKTKDEKAPVKKPAVKKDAPGAKRAAKIKLYTEDVKKHYGSVDETFLEIVVKNLGPSIYKKDAEAVSCTDPKELETVRKNFLIKKLGFDKEAKEMLDGEIQKVCETMKGTRIKYRATFYYILAKNLNKESALS